MGFAESIAKEVPKPSPCVFGEWQASLPKDEQAEVHSALVSTLTTSVIARAAQREGYPGSQDVLYRHRKGICACPSQMQ